MLIYHHNDLDGYAAAYLVQKQFADKNIDIDFEEINYPKVFPYDKVKDNELVFLVDTAFGNNTINNLFKLIDDHNCTVVWIDHHQTSVDVVKDDAHHFDEYNPGNYVGRGKLFHFIDNKFCGAMLTYAFFNTIKRYITTFNSEEEIIAQLHNMHYDYIIQDFNIEVHRLTEIERFNSSHSIPEWLYLTDQWDCWKFNNVNKEKVYDFHYGMDAIDISPVATIFDQLYDDVFSDSSIEKVIEQGNAINKYIEKTNRKALESSWFEAEINGIKTLCLNTTSSSSLVFGDRINNYSMVCVFHFDGSAGLWKYSVYSRMENGENCEKVAKTYGGGGHIHASGFSTEELIIKLPSTSTD